tara:strand:+ start:66 stop:329 length:264 start_codon:yes stop_codon:yes gene_type:complete
MKRLLLPIIAALALPTSAMAESTWLIIRYGMIGSSGIAATSLEKIKVSSNSQCELMGAKWVGTKLSKRESSYSKQSMIFGFECLTGE